MKSSVSFPVKIEAKGHTRRKSTEETITIKLPAHFKKAIEDEAARGCYDTTAELICERMRFCLPENIARDIQLKNSWNNTDYYRPDIEDKDKSIRVRVSRIVKKTRIVKTAIEKKIFRIGVLAMERDLGININHIPHSEKNAAQKGLDKDTKRPYVVQIEHPFADNIKKYVQKICEETGMSKEAVITNLVLIGMEARPLSGNQ